MKESPVSRPRARALFDGLRAGARSRAGAGSVGSGLASCGTSRLDLDLNARSHPMSSVGVRLQSSDNQAKKGARWMPRLQEATKDVGGCDKPRGAANQALIRGFLNGETHAGESRRIRW
jgi:hypothetical protein